MDQRGRRETQGKPRLRLRADKWEIHCRRLGLLTVRDRACALGVSVGNVTRVQNGTHAPGDALIAGALLVFRVAFEQLFEVKR